jgi:hypothetical protein
VALPLRVGIFSDVFGDVIAEAAELASKHRSSLVLMMRKLWSSV